MLVFARDRSPGCRGHRAALQRQRHRPWLAQADAPPKALTYRITALPPKTAVLDFMQRECGLDDHEAYGTLNMGAGFALYLDAADAPKAVEIAQGLGIPALIAGHLEEGAKRVIIEPLGVEFAGDELQLR